MHPKTRLDFKKQLTTFTNNNSVIQVFIIINNIVSCNSFAEYELQKITSRAKGEIKITDNTKFSISDYELIIWYGYVSIHNYISNNKKSHNQKMTSEIFNDNIFRNYISGVLCSAGTSSKIIPPTHMLYGYIERKAFELSIKERVNTLKEILK